MGSHGMRWQGRQGPLDHAAAGCGAALACPSGQGAPIAPAGYGGRIRRGVVAARAFAQVSARGFRMGIAVRVSVRGPLCRSGNRGHPPPPRLCGYAASQHQARRQRSDTAEQELWLGAPVERRRRPPLARNLTDPMQSSTVSHAQIQLFNTAESCLLAPYDLGAGKLERVFGSIMAHRIDYADLYFQYVRSEGWSLEEGIVKSGSFNIEQGVGVRAVSGEKTAFAFSDDISLVALEDAAKATRAIAHAGQQARVRAHGRASVARRGAGRDLYRPADPLASLADADKVRLLERLESHARALDPRVVQ